jgi:hypothetical protein
MLYLLPSPVILMTSMLSSSPVIDSLGWLQPQHHHNHHHHQHHLDLVGDPFFFFFFFFSLEIPGVFFSPVTQTQTQKSTFVAQEGMSLTRTSQEKKNKQTQKRKTHSQQCFYICL